MVKLLVSFYILEAKTSNTTRAVEEEAIGEAEEDKMHEFFFIHTFCFIQYSLSSIMLEYSILSIMSEWQHESKLKLEEKK